MREGPGEQSVLDVGTPYLIRLLRRSRGNRFLVIILRGSSWMGDEVVIEGKAQISLQTLCSDWSRNWDLPCRYGASGTKIKLRSPPGSR